MLKTIKRGNIIVLALTFVVALFSSYPTAHAANSCTVDVSPASAPAATITNFVLTITNIGTSNIQRIDFNVPSGSYTYAGNSIFGWSTADHDGGTTASGSMLDNGQRDSFMISAIASVADGPSSTWQIQASNNANGADPFSCSGNLSTPIYGHPANDALNGVSNVAVSNLGSSTATITWDSDMATSTIVYYGQTSEYGGTSGFDQALTTAHSVTLTGLSANTGYHYQVAGSDGQGSFAYSADNTFLTTSGQQGNNNNGNNTGPLGGGIPISSKPTETVPPTISLTNSFAASYKTAPAFNGVADDNVSVARVQFSTDGGKNWLPANQATGLGSKHVSFSFTPTHLEDGTYNLIARAIDTSGNIGSTAVKKIVIARVAPMVGGNIASMGSQVLAPDKTGVITSLAGVDQKITISAVGGPVSVTLTARMTNSNKRVQIFNLTKSPDTGLWSGIISFKDSGKYTLTAEAVNGAGVTNSRAINIVNVIKPARTIDQKTKRPVTSKITLYYFEPESKSWVIWDGAAYGQANPQTTDGQGGIKLFVPPGKYYLQASSKGYQTIVSKIFVASKTTPLTTDLLLKPQYKLGLGPIHLSFPELTVKSVKIETDQKSGSKSSWGSQLIGKPAPSFNLLDTNGKAVHTTDLLGRPTVLTLGSTWSPSTEEQLATLSQLQANKSINVVPVAIQEDAAKVQAYTTIAGLNLNWVVDPDSSLSSSYDIQSLPAHYFLDRKGTVKQVVTGVLAKQQIMSILGSM